jgi:hypothetical protein
MKIVLLSVNASWTHSCLALYDLRNAVSDLDYDVEIIELTLKQSLSEALEIIYTSKPDVLCLSVYIWNVEYLKQVVPDVRKLLFEVLIVAGGPEITFNEETYRAIQPDILIMRWGEKAFRELAEHGFQSGQKVLEGEHIPLRELPFPYLEEDKGQLQDRMVYYEASRGCACRCIYCLSARDEKTDWLPVERVCADLDKLLELQPKVIKFVDRSFNQNREWARAVWQYVISLETDIPFHFEVHPDWLEAEDIEILSAAPKGRIQLEIGVQSIHDKTLKLIGRPSDWNRVKANLEALREKTQIPLHTDLIVGLPGETRQQISESVNAVLKTCPAELQLGFLKILAGTAMEDYARQNDYLWSDSAPYTVLQTPDLAFADILELEKISLVINNYWNRGDFGTVWKIAATWREPYTCLHELLELSLATGCQLHSIDRTTRFELMSQWISQKWSEGKQSYLSDALRWDWCRRTSESWYPPAMSSSEAVKFRKDHYADVVEWLKQEYWQHEDWNFKRFIVFHAATFDFSRDFLGGYSFAVFVPVKGSDNVAVIYKKQF